MRDIPVFDTQYGVGSLSLKEVPYRQEAYITVGAVSDLPKFLQEVLDFCRAVGAEHLYATNHPQLEQYRLYNTLLQMSAARDSLPKTDACLFPVTERTVQQWKTIYNEKMRKVPNAQTMTDADMKKLLAEGVCYFIHRGEVLLGIGSVRGDTIGAIASLVPGGGREIVSALASAVFSDRVCLEVSDRNPKAMNLYQQLGFITICPKRQWYQIR